MFLLYFLEIEAIRPGQKKTSNRYLSKDGSFDSLR